MKKITGIIGCGIGAVMIGVFANKLSSGMGATLFAIGIVLLVSSAVGMAKEEKAE